MLIYALIKNETITTKLKFNNSQNKELGCQVSVGTFHIFLCSSLQNTIILHALISVVKPNSQNLVRSLQN